MEVMELKGFKSLRAFNAYHSLLLGLKMLPQHLGETYDHFLSEFELLEPSEQKKRIKEAVLFVELQKEEVEAMLSFCKDKNGIPYSAANIGNLKPDELVEAIVSVAVEISKIKVNLATETEKKN